MNFDINSMYANVINVDIKTIEKMNEDYRMRVLNKKYWPHQVFVSASQDAERWCYDNLKSSEWRNVGRYFAFKQGADATAFALKWS